MVVFHTVADKEENLKILQQCISSLLSDHTNRPDVITLLTSLVSAGNY